MSNNIVGIRYIGRKALKEDTITNSKATWVKDQVNNFSGDLAKQLLFYTDSFEIAEPDADADTFIGQQKAGQRSIEPVSFVNLNAMSIAQLETFARFQFNRTISKPEGVTVEQVRSEVNAMMTNNELDLLAEERKALASGLILEKEVTQSEYEAVLRGELILKLVPADIQPADAGGDDNADITNEDNTEANADVSTDIVKPAVEAESVANTATNEAETPTLQALVDSLDKAGLIALAKQENVSFANSMNEAQLRAKLIRDLTQKSGL